MVTRHWLFTADAQHWGNPSNLSLCNLWGSIAVCLHCIAMHCNASTEQINSLWVQSTLIATTELIIRLCISCPIAKWSFCCVIILLFIVWWFIALICLVCISSSLPIQFWADDYEKAVKKMLEGVASTSESEGPPRRPLAKFCAINSPIQKSMHFESPRRSPRLAKGTTAAARRMLTFNSQRRFLLSIIAVWVDEDITLKVFELLHFLLIIQRTVALVQFMCGFRLFNNLSLTLF